MDIVIAGLFAIIAALIGAYATYKLNKLPSNRRKLLKSTTTHFNSDIILPNEWVDKSQDIKRIYKLLRVKRNHVIEIQGLGGSGKSCFTRKMIESQYIQRRRYNKIIWFSFYKLKSTIDPFEHFLDFSLEILDRNFNEYQDTSTVRKRNSLERILRRKRYLIILDGFEILQSDKFSDFGKVNNNEFRAFLKSACNFPKTQIVITTRIKLTDLVDIKGFAEFRLSNWNIQEFSSFIGQKNIYGPKTNKQLILDTLGSHPLTLTVFKYLVTEHYNNSLEKTDAIIQTLIEDIKKEEYDNSSAYEKQLSKLKTILVESASYWNGIEFHIMKRLSCFYGEVYTEHYQVLIKNKDISISRFKKAIENFTSLSLINKGIRDGKDTLSAHPMIKHVIYELMSHKERINIHKELAHFFESRPKPISPKMLSDLDDLMEWFQQTVRSESLNEAINIWEDQKLKNMLHFGGWYKAHLELIESLSQKVLNDSQKRNISIDAQIKLEMTLGHTTRKLGRIRDALNHFNEARSIAVNNNLEREIYESEIELAITHGFKGDFDQTFHLMPKAPQKDPSYYDGALYEWTGYAKGIQGDYTASHIDLEEATKICRSRKDMRHLAPILTHYGDILTLEGEFSLAFEKYSESLDICEKESYKDYEGDARRGLGDYHRLSQDYNQAKSYYEEALEISIDLGYRYLNVEVLLGLARLALKTNRRSDKSKNYALEGLELAKESEYTTLQAEALIILAICEKKDKKAFRKNIADSENILASKKINHLNIELSQVKSSNNEKVSIFSRWF